MSVKFCKKKLKGGNISLYIDIYHKGKRNYEFLIYMLPNQPKLLWTGSTIKEVKELANQIRVKREIEIQSMDYDHAPAFKRKASFLAFAGMIADEKRKSLPFGN